MFPKKKQKGETFKVVNKPNTTAKAEDYEFNFENIINKAKCTKSSSIKDIAMSHLSPSRVNLVKIQKRNKKHFGKTKLKFDEFITKFSDKVSL